jgi:hypothetical protein
MNSRLFNNDVSIKMVISHQMIQENVSIRNICKYWEGAAPYFKA